MLLLLEAVKNLWDSSGMGSWFPGGIHASGAVPPDAARPYVVALPLTESPRHRTNRGRYPELHVQFEVLADEMEQATTLALQWREVLLAGPLTLPAPASGLESERLLVLDEGPMSWKEEDLFWRVLVEFTGRVSRPPLPK